MSGSPSKPPPPIEASYVPRGAAWKLLHCQAPEVLISGPAGTGKSVAALFKLHLCAESVPGLRALILRKTRASLSESGLVSFEQFVLPEDHPARAGPRRPFRQSYRYPNGSEIILGGLDKPTRIMSTEYDLVYVQEAIEVDVEAWEAITTRLRHGAMPYHQLIADTNPDKPTHWLKRRCGQGATLLLESRHEDNPLLWDAERGEWTTVGFSYLAKLDALTGPRKLRLRHGRWVQAEGIVYESYDPAVHLVDRFEIPPEWPRVLSVDFGFTNPFVCQWWAVDGDGRIFRYREIYSTKGLVEDHARRILELGKDEPPPVAIVCDHDAEDRATLERYLGQPTIPAQKAKSPGIQAVQTRLRKAADGKPRLFFLRDSLDARDHELLDRKLPCCTEEEIDGYCFVAWTEIMTMKGPKPIQDIDLGDCVWTRSGLKKVSAVAKTCQSARVWTVKLSNGRQLTGTGDHPIFVHGKGMSALSSLSSSDTLEAWPPQYVSYSTESLTDDIHRPSGFRTASIFAPHKVIGLKGQAACMSIFGCRFTARFRKGAIFITEMATHLITQSTIYSALRRASTCRPTEATLFAGRQSGLQNSMLPENCRQNGPERRKAGKLLAGGACDNGKAVSLPNGSACSAEQDLQAASLASLNSALAHAIPHGGLPESLITKSDLAHYAATNSRLTSGRKTFAVPVRVLSVTEELAPAPVYNLTVEDCHEYYANGILVHNCWDTRAGARKGDQPVDKDNHGVDATRYMVAGLDFDDGAESTQTTFNRVR